MKLRRASFRQTALSCFLTLFAAQAVNATVTFVPATKDDGRSLWAYEIGCAFVTDNTVAEILFTPQTTHIEKGYNGGEVYTLTVSRRLGELNWQVFGHEFHPQMELPVTLEIVDENSRSPFLDYNAAYMMRWVDFPWNKYILTSFGTGVGLSYSSKIYRMDTAAHEGEDRSNLKIYWPIQWTFALPAYPKDQLTVFIAHQSGGHIFDAGGINCVGLGYRRGF